MALNIVALVVVVIASIVLPLVVLGILIGKKKEEWKGIVGLFLCGAAIYGVMQWLLKQHALTWLFNHTGFMDFMNQHYIPYLLVVALAGAVLVVLPQMFVVIVPWKKNVSFVKAISFGLGYGMMESILLIGARSINTIVELLKGEELELSTTTVELFLSGYERVLILIIEIAIVVGLTFFIEHGMPIRGGLLAVFCYTLVSFLPGFFIAFSLSEYYEVYSRSIALVIVYILLTASAFTGLVILNAVKYQLKD